MPTAATTTVTTVNTTYWPLCDANGNVSEYLAASDGSIAAHYEYDPFGNTTVASGAHAANFAHRFSSKFLDAETGLYYYGVRYLNTETGRWASRDPMGEAGGECLYVFAGNDAVLWIDPYGLDWLDDSANFSAGVADTLTMSATSWLRRKAGVDTMVYYGGGAYFAGEIAEITVETTVTLGGAALRRASVRYAGRAGRYVLEGNARAVFRRVHRLDAAGGIIHHVNPIRQGRFPLPFRASARGFWNMQWLSGSSVSARNTLHIARHRYLRMLDTADYLRTWTQPIRAAGNEIYRRIMASGAGAMAVQSPQDQREKTCLYAPDITIEQRWSIGDSVYGFDEPLEGDR